MTIGEFSNEFDTLVASYRRFKAFDSQEILDSIEFDEYEKSVFLTDAQETLIVNLYNGKNAYGDAFESSEEMRRYLHPLVKTASVNVTNEETGIDEIHSYVPQLNGIMKNILYIVYEKALIYDEEAECLNQTWLDVYPVTHDEYANIKDNPFRGPTDFKAIRLDPAISSSPYSIELVSKYNLSKYFLRYIEKPTPIILEDLPSGLSIRGETLANGSVLPEVLHTRILEIAVTNAINTKINNSRNNSNKE